MNNDQFHSEACTFFDPVILLPTCIIIRPCIFSPQFILNNRWKVQIRRQISCWQLWLPQSTLCTQLSIIGGTISPNVWHHFMGGADMTPWTPRRSRRARVFLRLSLTNCEKHLRWKTSKIYKYWFRSFWRLQSLPSHLAANRVTVFDLIGKSTFIQLCKRE